MRGMECMRRRMRRDSPFSSMQFFIRIPERRGGEDELAFSTHYGEAAHLINQYLREHTFRLIEAAAENAAEQILLRFSPGQES